ncbi:uncharacterized protein LOC111396456 [Olea europaea var. sylvestris]|uniref:uncharacterized protein LOC111396456 n=1 Tax=Olea europaea var. sylvestris TaxID=158386 RepID=UPI000C1D78F1|nr:uncharacterized protein LOC111396456 [Olea europaea var. sylvestris]
MASMVADNWESIVCYDDFINNESSYIDQNILMSLLDESHNEDCDDERLTNVIRSLEAEIAPNNTDCYLSNNLKLESDPIECQSSSDESTNEQNFSKLHDLDFQWMDLEMVPSSPTSGMASWYMGSYEQEMDAMTEFDGLKFYSQISYETPLMEEHDFGLLWQETNDSQMKN